VRKARAHTQPAKSPGAAANAAQRPPGRRRPNLAACARIVAPLTAKESGTLMDLLIRVIESNEAYARPGLGRRKRGSRVQPGKG
jgi:hypothetical protein